MAKTLQSELETLLFEMEESIEDNFTTFHNNLFELKLSNHACMLYLFIKKMAYGKKTFSYPSVKTLAEQFKVERRTIQRWLQELINRGVITRIEWFNDKTKMQTSNRYLIRDIAKIETGYDKNVAPENTGFEAHKTLQPSELGCDKNVIPGVTKMSYHEELQYKEKQLPKDEEEVTQTCTTIKLLLPKSPDEIIQELTQIHGEEKTNLAIEKSKGTKFPVRYIEKVLNDWKGLTLEETQSYIKRNAKKGTRILKKSPPKTAGKYEKFYL
jgi:DNA-binding MarR family transcriptional regulator